MCRTSDGSSGMDALASNTRETKSTLVPRAVGTIHKKGSVFKPLKS